MLASASAAYLFGCHSQEQWLEFASAKIGQSSYQPEKDAAAKVVAALKCSMLTKGEFEVYTADFKELDTDSDGFLDQNEVRMRAGEREEERKEEREEEREEREEEREEREEEREKENDTLIPTLDD